LLALFWPDLDTEHARAALRRALYFLRQQLGEDVLVNRGDEEVGITEGRLWCDAAEFERIIGSEPAKALELYRGDLLEGFYVAGANEAEHWFDERRSHLKDRATRALWKLAEDPASPPDAAAEWARRAAALNPEDEDDADRLQKLLASLRRVPAPPRPRADMVPGLVAVQKFAVHGDASAAYLAEGMMHLLRAALHDAGDLHTTDAAAPAGAEYAVEGSVVASAGKLRITASLKRLASGDVVSRADAQRDHEQDLFDLVDDLVRQLLTARSAGPEARLARIAAVTTASLPALKAYLRGEEAMRAGRLFDAFAGFSEATSLDLAFALAWYRLAGTCAATLMIEQARAASSRALEHKARLTERDRILLEAQYAWLHGRSADAERRYGTAVTMFPDDLEAWYLLGDVQFHSNPYRGRSISEGGEPLKRALALDPGHVGALVKLARIAALEGDRSAVEEFTQRALARSPDGDQSLAMRALRAFISGDAAGQQAVMQELRTAKALPAVIAFGDVALYTGDLAGAERVGRAFLAVARADELKAVCHLMLAHLALAGGRREAAWRELEHAEPLAPSWTREVRGLFAAMPFVPLDHDELTRIMLHLDAWDTSAAQPKIAFPLILHNEIHTHLRAWLLGQLAARRGDAAACLTYAELLGELAVPATFTVAIQQLTRSLDAQARRIQGRTADALQALEGASTDVWYQHTIASPLFAGTFDRYLRGLLLEETGQADEAVRWLESLTERSAWELPFAAPAALRAAAIHEKAGRPDQAKKAWARAARLWASCDDALKPQRDEAAEKSKR
jgi:DNA-binding SARP family transcriptional activator